MRENIKAKGEVLIQVKDARTGEVIENIGCNKIVNSGLNIVAKLLGGAGLGITKIGVGEGTSTTTETNTALTNSFVKNIDSVVYPMFNKVQFNFSLSAQEANGLKISELGLLNSDNVLFSRKTRTEIIKTENVVITGVWTITIN